MKTVTKQKDLDHTLLVSRAREPTCSELWQAMNLGLQDLKEKHWSDILAKS